MCKIFTFTNMSKIKNINKTIEVVAEALSFYERDGFGYAIQTDKGLFGEKSVESKNFKYSHNLELLDFSFLQHNYAKFGERGKINGGGIFHGRTSTNHKNIVNTHPISKRDWTLIHNGVVTNHGPDYDMTTTNDTEHLVEYMSTQGISAIEKHLTGYYAFAAFSPDNKLHVVRDSIAQLHFAHIKSIDSFVIATTADLIEDVCDTLKLKHSKISAIKDNQHIVFNNNKIESISTIKPRGRTTDESKYASLSLGYELQDLSKSVKTWTDEELFLNEVNNYSDSSYQFLDYRNNVLTLADFKALTNDEKLSCTVIRSDGTIVCPNDYNKERIYMGY